MRFRPLPGLTLAALLGVGALLALGMWQLQRLAWKTELIAAAESRAHQAPAELASLLGKPAAAIEYAHVRARGRFMPGEVYLFAKVEDGRVGYEVIAPFRLANGPEILVDRGFVEGTPPGGYDPPPEGDVEIQGLVRAAHGGGCFTPRPDAARRVWYVRDAAAMGQALRLSPVPPLVVALDAGPPGARPEGGQTKLAFRNEHLEYALTWFALAGVLAGVYFAYHRSKGRLQF